MAKTRPRQAASARSLDRWQRDVAGILRGLSHVPRVIKALKGLQKSFQKSERR